MKRYSILVTVLILGLLSATAYAAPLDYNQILLPAFGGNTSITWNVIESPTEAVEWAFIGQGSWMIEEGGTMEFLISEVDTDVEGTLRIGNSTIDANNTDIGFELVLGLWGAVQWFPGLVVPVGEGELAALNETAYTAAERVQGNYLNGTMVSSSEDVTIGTSVYSCFVFNYVQDPTMFGEPQRTTLAYDTTTGILVRGNTSYSFGEPYSLIIELASVVQFGIVTTGLVTTSIIMIVGILAVIMYRRR